jgi:hypothetical protein
LRKNALHARVSIRIGFGSLFLLRKDGKHCDGMKTKQKHPPQVLYFVVHKGLKPGADSRWTMVASASDMP